MMRLAVCSICDVSVHRHGKDSELHREAKCGTFDNLIEELRRRNRLDEGQTEAQLRAILAEPRCECGELLGEDCHKMNVTVLGAPPPHQFRPAVIRLFLNQAKDSK